MTRLSLSTGQQHRQCPKRSFGKQVNRTRLPDRVIVEIIRLAMLMRGAAYDFAFLSRKTPLRRVPAFSTLGGFAVIVPSPSALSTVAAVLRPEAEER
ncbi:MULTISPECIES: hypothetical protein [Amycolatopsis]|uniref:Uncharacterized protein n=1 Tax=Amycolatopsis dendrobii TaxID=2760662 RepID=A0A7W3VZ19_9PSEU|nr:MULTISPECIES: hypothetical protein [Amycolatopsis]MBB1155332.1 hypothetical protein [Amycolatopsis dendrobii]UKD54728.1 hypothetical protein L3Q65_43880 [Amycolatopsis sp. FU40]